MYGESTSHTQTSHCLPLTPLRSDPIFRLTKCTDGENCTDCTGPLCPTNRNARICALKFHTMTEPSSLADASCFMLGLKLRLRRMRMQMASGVRCDAGGHRRAKDDVRARGKRGVSAPRLL